MTAARAFWAGLMIACLVILIAVFKWPDGIGSLAPPDHPRLEITFWVAQIIVPLMALGALGYAAYQIDEARQMRLVALNQARAQFLLRLDQRWDSPEIGKSLIEFYKLRAEAISLIEKASPSLSDVATLGAAAKGFVDTLRDLRASNPLKYSEVTLMLGFFETVGVMVKRGYVLDDDIYDLFSGAILDVGLFFRAHIAERNDEMGVLKGLYEHAMLLVDRIEKVRIRRLAGNP